MNELAVPPAPHRNQHPPELTRKKQAEFLLLLAKTGQHVRCCQAVGIDNSRPLQWADKNELFAKRFEEAKKKGEQVLLLAYEADLDAVVAQPLFLQHTSNLRMFRMKRLDPRYRDSATVQVAVLGPAQLVLGCDEDDATGGGVRQVNGPKP